MSGLLSVSLSHSQKPPKGWRLGNDALLHLIRLATRERQVSPELFASKADSEEGELWVEVRS